MQNPELRSASEVVGAYLAAAIRGEPLPTLMGSETRELLTAIRLLLSREGGDAKFHRELELLAFNALGALSTRLRAEVHFAKAVGNARLQ